MLRYPRLNGLDEAGAARAAAATPAFAPFVNPNAEDDLLAPGSAPAGALTGAPVQTQLRTAQIPPGPNGLIVVPYTRENRIAVFTAPLIGYRIFIGGAGVNTRNGLYLTPGLPYDISLPGNQELFAVTDAPMPLPLRVQISQALMGDREREYKP